MENVRAEIKDQVEATSLADTWLFEFSSSSAGVPPSEQYLQAARDCDVFVLLIDAAIRQATIDEYDRAVDDTPDKILAFQLGSPPAGLDDFRRTLRQRHTVRRVTSLKECPSAVAAAIVSLFETGTIVRQSAVSRLVSSRNERRLLLGLPEGFSFERQLRIPAGTFPDELIRVGSRNILVGPAGVGKSDVLLGALTSNALEARIPLVLRARPTVRAVEELIRDSFDALRFTPGSDLVRQYLRDGRVVLAVDGLDEIPTDDRSELIRSIEDLASTYPRTSILVASRESPSQRFVNFAMAELAPLSAEQVDELFRLAGYQSHAMWHLAPPLRELAVMPFWAPLLARSGQTARSGLQLLDELVTHRLSTTMLADDIRQRAVREGLGALAVAVRPATETPVENALRIVAGWASQPEVGRRYVSTPAETILELGRAGGLVRIDGPRVIFAHRLLATYLAGASIATESGALTTDARSDPELASVVIGLLPEGRQGIAVKLMTDGGILVLAAALRMSGPTVRRSALGQDLGRFDAAYTALEEGILGPPAVSMTSHALVVGAHVCLRRVPGKETSIARDMWLAEWTGSQSKPAEYLCWKANPFESQTPEVLAAQAVLGRFKQRFAELRPAGSPYAPPGTDGLRLAQDRERISSELLAHVQRQAHARHSVLQQLRLTGSSLEWPSGEPRVVVAVGDHDARYTSMFGEPGPSVGFVVDDTGLSGSSLSSVMADPEALAYADLERDLAVSLGSPLSSQALRTPSQMGWSL